LQRKENRFTQGTWWTTDQ